jgi:CRP-like cAMP-binding protein
MHAAQQFGELALIDHKKRKATVVCHTDCDFGVLSKEDFDLILKEEH